MPVVLLLTTGASNMIEAADLQKGFTETQLDVPEGIQLLVAAGLLCVFAAAVRSSEDEKPKSEGENEKKIVNLVRADRIALRLACAAGIIGVVQMAPAAMAGISQLLPKSPPKGFANSEASLGDVPEGVQLLAVSALLFMFKLAIDDDDSEKSGEEKENEKESRVKTVQLVRADAIALRLSCAAMITGCVKLASGSVSSAGPSPWSGASSAKDALVYAFMQLNSLAPKSEAFGKSEAVLEVPEGVQFLVLAALLFVFKLAVDESESEEASKKGSAEEKEKPKVQNVQLVKPGRIACRLAVAAGAVGVCKTLSPVIARAGDALVGSKELLAQGGLLAATTGFVLWNSRKQMQNMKA